MNNVLILGASGSIARLATRLFLDDADVILTLYVRNARRLGAVTNDRVRVIVGRVPTTSRVARAARA